MGVEVLTFVSRMMDTNTFLVRSGDACAVIDLGFGPDAVLAFLRRGNVVPDEVILTHGHCDHIAGIHDLHAQCGPVPVWCPAADAAMLTDAAANLSAPFGLTVTVPPADRQFAAGEGLEIGRTRWEVLDTSGHTPGGVSLYCRDEAVVFTGDALFAMGIGRTDFPGGDAARLLGNIRRNLLSLPPDTVVYPGHGPATTIGREARGNPFLADASHGD